MRRILSGNEAIALGAWKAGDATYPSDEAIEAALRVRSDDVTLVEGLEIAERLGNPRLANTALLGALSGRLEKIDPTVWLGVIVRRVPPQYVELNREAFWEGRELLVVKA